MSLPHNIGKNNQQGFTLIEVVVYLALFAMLFGGTVLAAYNIIEGSGRGQTRAMLQEEGDFLEGKISWALFGAQGINNPGIGASGSQLSVNKITGVDANNNPIVLAIVIGPSGTSDASLTLGGTPYTLNNSTVKVSSLLFTHNSASGDGVNPESLAFSFTLTSLTSTGQSISQDFNDTIYLRK